MGSLGITALLGLASLLVPAVVHAGGLSPDGRHVAFAVPLYDAQAEPMTEVRLMPVEGSKARKLAAMPGFLPEVYWLSTDEIALASGVRAQCLRIVTMAGERLPDRVLPFGYVNGGTLVPSPDGRRLCFTASHRRKDGEQKGVFVCDLADMKPRCLLETGLLPGWLNRPAWSPHSRRVALGVTKEGVREPRLVIVDVETGAVEETGAAGAGASWSPDGRYIACAAGFASQAPLGIYEVATRKMKVFPGTEGAVRPSWSPDGAWVACQWNPVGGPGDVLLVQSGGGIPVPIRRMRDVEFVLDLLWSDPQTLFMRTDQRLCRLSFPESTWRTLEEWDLERPKEPDPKEYRVLELPRVAVRYARMEQRYAEAHGRIVAEEIRLLEEMGFALPAKVTLDVRTSPHAPWFLGTMSYVSGDGDSRISIRLGGKDAASPGGAAGQFVLYRLGEQLAVMALYRGLGSSLGLTEDLARGWCEYLGGLSVARVTESLGAAIWPEACDVLPATEAGPMRSTGERWRSGPWEQIPERGRSKAALYRLGEEHGHGRTASAMARALATRPCGKDLMSSALAQLRALTGDATAGEWIPPEALVPAFRRPPDLAGQEGFFAEQKTDRTLDGVALSYGSGVAEARRASGRGCATLFRAPAGNWQLDRVRVFASRSVESDDPEGRFSLCICDAGLSLLREFQFPVKLFPSGDGAWGELKVEPVDVPEAFYLCVVSPPYTGGAFTWLGVGIDTGVQRPHSLYAQPYLGDLSPINTDDEGDEEKGDWMIQPHLRPRP